MGTVKLREGSLTALVRAVPGEARRQQPGGCAAAGEGGAGVRARIPLRGCESGGPGGEHPQV